jgi:hypothetical protein
MAAHAASYPGNITLTPESSIAIGSQYHVAACGLKRNATHAVDTTGPNYSYTRNRYDSDASGCIQYDAVAGSVAGQYTITVQQERSWRLAVVDVRTFTVQ